MVAIYPNSSQKARTLAASASGSEGAKRVIAANVARCSSLNVKFVRAMTSRIKTARFASKDSEGVGLGAGMRDNGHLQRLDFSTSTLKR